MQFTPGQPENASNKPFRGPLQPSLPLGHLQTNATSERSQSHSGTRIPVPIAPAHHDKSRNGVSGPNVPPPPPWSYPESPATSSAPKGTINPDVAVISTKKRKHSGEDRSPTPDSLHMFEQGFNRKTSSSSSYRSVSDLTPAFSKIPAQRYGASPHHSPSYQARPHPSPSRRSPVHPSPSWSPPSPKGKAPAAGIEVTSVPNPPTVRKVTLLVRDSQYREREGLQDPINTPVTTSS